MGRGDRAKEDFTTKLTKLTKKKVKSEFCAAREALVLAFVILGGLCELRG